MRRIASLLPHLVAGAVLVGAGCEAGPKESALAARAPLAEERALCLFAPPRSGAIDDEILERRAEAERLPDKADAWVLLGRAWVKRARNLADAGGYLHADACAQIALAKAPDHVPALGIRAMAMLHDHRFAEAARFARQVLAHAPRDLVTLGVLADALLELGDVEGSEAAVQTMIDTKPGLPSYARASYLQWLRGEKAAAVASIRLAYDAGRGQKDPEPTAWVLTEAANLFWHEGDLEGALAGYDLALSQKPDHAPALFGKGRALVGLGRRAEAVPLLEESLAREPLVETARWLSAAHDEGSEEAQRARERALAIGRAGDARALALFLATTNERLREAETLLEREAERGDLYTDDARALVAWRRGAMSRALELSERATRFGTKDARLLLHRGVILRAAGDARGPALIDEALAQNPHLDPFARALAGGGT